MIWKLTLKSKYRSNVNFTQEDFFFINSISKMNLTSLGLVSLSSMAGYKIG